MAKLSRIIYDIPKTQLIKKKIQAIQCPDVYSESLKTDKIRVIHISDTHLNHNDYFDYIPNGDILIHSGDFSPEDGPIKRKRNGSKGMIPKIKQFAQWLKALPHQKKIIIGGNHERALMGLTKEEIQTDIFGNDDGVVYLQDDIINFYGINIYGTPWNEREYMAFGADNDG
eukprot:61416_1